MAAFLVRKLAQRVMKIPQASGKPTETCWPCS